MCYCLKVLRRDFFVMGGFVVTRRNEGLVPVRGGGASVCCLVTWRMLATMLGMMLATMTST
jgi:hypothetical protein